MDIQGIRINKNRGWRGLSEVACFDGAKKQILTMIFSFSQNVWDDMQRGYIVVQDNDYYYVLNFNNTDELPKGQRSVLITYFYANVISYYRYNKNKWADEAKDNGHYDYIYNFTKNRNNHTTSDWNCIGIRVVPSI